jgi:hypothetical protein
VKGFKPTARNIAILMLDRFDTDQTKHKRRVEEALALLEQNTYTQRNGELFEFLTDEEKDVEQEIKAVKVDSPEIAKELETLIFDGVIKARKLRHEASSQDFGFARYLDDRPVGRDQELAINVITPFHENGSTAAVALRTMTKDELAIVLAADDRFRSDLMMFRRTDKYIRQANAAAQLPAIQRILIEKGQQNETRQRELAAAARSLLAAAKLFVRGEEIEIRSEDPLARIARGFQVLVDKVHVNLGMLREVAYAESDIDKSLTHAADGLFAAGSGVTEAEQEILNFAQSNARTGLRTTAKGVAERFERKPYGWSYAAILCTTASLIGRGKLEARTNGALLEGDALKRDLQNANAQGNIVLEPQVEFSAAQTRKLKEFHAEFFDSQPAGAEGKALGLETAAAFTRLKADLASLEAQSPGYPFLSALTPLRDAVDAAAGKPYAWYVQELGPSAERLLDMKESILDPVRRFMGGAQKTIYDEARAFLTAQAANFAYVGEDRASSIRTFLDDPACFKGNTIQRMKSELDELKQDVSLRVAAERARGVGELDELHHRLQALPDYPILQPVDRRIVEDAFDAVGTGIGQASLIAVIRETVSRFKSSTYPSLLDRVTAPALEPVLETAGVGTSRDDGGVREAPPVKPVPPAVRYVAASNLHVAYAKAYLADEDDVDSYLHSLRGTMIAAIRAGKRISI